MTLSVFAHEINNLVSSFNLIAVLHSLTLSFSMHSLESHTRKVFSMIMAGNHGHLRSSQPQLENWAFF